jgi:hypothetical protein
LNGIAKRLRGMFPLREHGLECLLNVAGGPLDHLPDRELSSGKNHEKQFFGLLAGCCCG